MKAKPGVAVWADAVRDSDLPKITKLVAHTLRTYLNRRLTCYPSRPTLAAGASVSLRSVDGALSGLEQAGFLTISRSRGRSSNLYTATLPPEAAAARQDEWRTAHGLLGNGADRERNGANGATNGAPCAPKSGESEIESVEVIIDEPLTLNPCFGCNESVTSTEWDAGGGYCSKCRPGVSA